MRANKIELWLQRSDLAPGHSPQRLGWAAPGWAGRHRHSGSPAASCQSAVPCSWWVSSPGRRQASFIPCTCQEGEMISAMLLLVQGTAHSKHLMWYFPPCSPEKQNQKTYDKSKNPTHLFYSAMVICTSITAQIRQSKLLHRLWVPEEHHKAIGSPQNNKPDSRMRCTEELRQTTTHTASWKHLHERRERPVLQ